MMFSKSLMSSLFVLMSFLAVVMPMPLHKRDVFVPPVVTPDANTVWVVGQYYDVTW